MIDSIEVERLLNGEITERIICHEFEWRPSFIAQDIKKLANLSDDYGFIIIGAASKKGKYVINGAASKILIEGVVTAAQKQLTVKPQTEISQITIKGKNIYIIKVYKINEGTSLLSDKLESPSITEFINRLYSICITLQSREKFIDASEDDRNDYIRDMLGRYDEYEIKDQTRRGLSASGDSPGEVDLYVEKDKMPFTIIEALNLSSLNQSYLAKHINKIYTYDTAGNTFNICLVYAELKSFASFWEKYCKFVSEYDFPYPMVETDEIIDSRYCGTEIKIMSTTHNRSGQLTRLYHICVKILSK